MRQLFQIKTYPNDKNRMIIPTDYYQDLKHISTLQHGLQSIPCEILSHHNKTNTIYLSSSIMNQLHLTYDIPIIIDTDAHTCHIHYPFGVFIHHLPSQTAYERLFQEMARVGHTMGFQTIFFSYQQVQLRSNSLTGFVWNEQEWQIIETEIPPVIYNRIPNRQIESHKRILQIKKHLAANSIIFNPDFFNKWQVYDKLMNHGKISYLLPDTTFHPSIQTIQDKLTQHSLYLESLRQDIYYYLEQVGDSLFVTVNKSQHLYYQSLEQFKQVHFPDGFRQYVLQDAIDLLKYQGEPFYIRVHMNKTKRWHISFLYGKKAASNDIFPLDKTIEVEGIHLIKKVEARANILSNILEDMLPNRIGEIGFDIGIDQELRLWLLEVHAKPSWQVLYHPSFSKQTQAYFTSLFQFYLAMYIGAE